MVSKISAAWMDFRQDLNEQQMWLQSLGRPVRLIVNLVLVPSYVGLLCRNIRWHFSRSS